MIKFTQLHQLAAGDIDAALDYYVREAGEPVANHFIDALETALNHLSRHPLTGSLRYSYELDIPNLRAWPLTAFPYVVFYSERPSFVEVWRVLHAHSDIPRWLTSSDCL